VSSHLPNGTLVPIDCSTLTSSAPSWVKVGEFTANADGTCSAQVTSTKPGIFPVTVLQDGAQVGLPLDTHFIAIVPPLKQGADGSLSVSAAGFLPGELVDVWVHPDALQVGKGLVADEDGNVTVTFKLPANFPSGVHSVYFVGRDSGATDAASFKVAADDIVPAGGYVTSSGGLAGSLTVLLVMLGGAAVLWRRQMVSVL